MNLFVDGIIFGKQVFGGVANAWLEYLERLRDLDDINVDVFVPLAGSNRVSALCAGCANMRVIPNRLVRPFRIWERTSVRSRILLRHSRRKNFDAFHSSYYSTVYERKLVKLVTVYDMIPEMKLSADNANWVSRETRLKKKALENSDIVITISDNTKRDLLRIYPWISERRIETLHLGVSAEYSLTPPTLDEVNEQYGIQLKPFSYFLFVGKRSGYKNFRVLMSLLREYATYREYTYVCVGDDLVGEDYEQCNREWPKRFRFIPFVERSALSSLYRTALAFVYPSLYEGFGLPILEAMAAGCPVVCSNASSFPEVAGNAALFFEPNSVSSFFEAMETLRTGDRQFWVQAGLDNISRFSWDRSAERLISIYRSIERNRQ